MAVNCVKPYLPDSKYQCACHRCLGNDFWFLPEDGCIEQFIPQEPLPPLYRRILEEMKKDVDKALRRLLRLIGRNR